MRVKANIKKVKREAANTPELETHSWFELQVVE